MKIASLAKQLHRARQNGGRVALKEYSDSLDIETGYEVQRSILALSGEQLVGFKVGATTKVAMDLLGLSEPFHGPLVRNCCRPSGSQISIPPQQQVLLEAEIAVKLSRDLPANETHDGYDSIANAIEWIAPAMELCSFRCEAELAGNGSFLIADSGINMYFVSGEPVSNFQKFDLAAHPVQLLVNGIEVAQGSTGVSKAGHPFGVVAWLANDMHLGERGLRAGDVIITGSCTGLFPVKAGDIAVADFGELGQVRVSFAQEPS